MAQFILSMKGKIIFWSLGMLMGILFCNNSFAQPNKIKHQNRLGDSLVLKDISEKPTFQKRPKARTKDFSGGLMMATDGYGFVLTGAKAFGYEDFGYGNEEKYYNAHFVQLEISERFHRKEYRDLSYSALFNLLVAQHTNYYIYGKINNLYQVKLSYGQRRLFGGKGEPKSPLIQYFVALGPSLALVKPYYVTTAFGGVIKFDSTTYKVFLDKEAIAGRPSLSKGFDEIEPTFGAHLKGGLHFDFAQNPKRISAFDLGFSLDYYFQPITQMAETKAQSFFAQLYLTYQFGKRW